MAVWRVVKRRGNCLLYVHNVVVAKLVEFFCGNAMHHKRRNVIKHFAGEFADDAHFCDGLLVVKDNGHGCVSKLSWADFNSNIVAFSLLC